MIAAIQTAAPDLLVPNRTLLRQGAGMGKILAPFQEIYACTVDREPEIREFLRGDRMTGIITNYPPLGSSQTGIF